MERMARNAPAIANDRMRILQCCYGPDGEIPLYRHLAFCHPGQAGCVSQREPGVAICVLDDPLVDGACFPNFGGVLRERPRARVQPRIHRASAKDLDRAVYRGL
jgi:hypothetical protein